VSDELAAIRVRIAELNARAERALNLANAIAFDGCNVLAAAQAAELAKPLWDEVYPVELLGKYNAEFAVLAFEHLELKLRWPTVRELLASFGHWFRYTERAASRLLAAELSKPHHLSAIELMAVGDDEILNGLGDYRVAVKLSELPDVAEAYRRHDFVVDALDTGMARAAAGDPDPFGLNEGEQ
jgi:hypothetical protein